MLETANEYYECPVCHWILSFRFDYGKYKYVSVCPYCKDVLEMDKEELERNNREIYFKADF